MQPTTWAWLLALLAWSIIMAFYGIEGGASFEPVDCWVAEPALEMYEAVEQQGWRGFLKPYFAGELFMHKSPGPYWAVWPVAKLSGLGVTEATVRVPNAIAGVLLVITIFWLTRRIAGDRAAIFAGFAAAGSVGFLYWSHRGSADLAVSTLTTMSLACLWVGSESEPPGAKRVVLWLLGYLFAGLAMIYKMPMPLVCVGIPALLYVLLRNRWRIFASPWHLLGLLLFLLPWLPWAIWIVSEIPATLPKWRVEYWDRITGDLPNVVDQFQWYFYLVYIGVALLLTVPFAISLPQAIARMFKRSDGVNREGRWFLLIWFISLFAFFTASTGKESRYFLPVMAPLYVMLGIELARFFDPNRRASPGRDRFGFWTVAVLTPAAMVGGMFMLRNWFEKNVTEGMFAFSEVLRPAIVGAAIFTVGCIIAAGLYQRRRESASFAALVGTSWLTWLWVWPMLTPMLAAQTPYKDFAAQLKALPVEYHPQLRQIAHHDPRVIWYSGLRFPRLLDQLELLEEEGGQRDLQWEIKQYGKKMIEVLGQDDLALFVISEKHYVQFMCLATEALAKEGRTMPATHIWLQARPGQIVRRYILLSNQPPPWPEPEVQITDKQSQRIRESEQRAAEVLGEPATTQPTSP